MHALLPDAFDIFGRHEKGSGKTAHVNCCVHVRLPIGSAGSNRRCFPSGVLRSKAVAQFRDLWPAKRSPPKFKERLTFELYSVNDLENKKHPGRYRCALDARKGCCDQLSMRREQSHSASIWDIRLRRVVLLSTADLKRARISSNRGSAISLFLSKSR